MTTPFTVLVAPTVNSRIRTATTPRDVRHAFAEVVRSFRSRGCAAADYRLRGPAPWAAHCVKTLPRNWRLVVDFPRSDEVRLLALEPHTNDNDPYLNLATQLGVARVAGLHGGKTRCCEPDGTPPSTP